MADDVKTVRVLSLDGGGVRGLSSMVILDYLLDLVQEQLARQSCLHNSHEILPSELFDHIVGTSTGGLIAVMLVKLNMPIGKCIQVYKRLIPRIFGKRRLGSCLGGLGVPRYSHDNFRKCIQEVFDEFGPKISGETIRYMEEDNIGSNGSSCHYCRNTQKETGKYTPYELWMTCRATTAAPTFFPPMKIDGRTFVDGAFGNTNNPTRKAHFHFLSKVSGYKDCPVLWLNIGTGSPKPQHDALSTRSRRSSTAMTSKRNWTARLIPRAIREAQNLLSDLEAIATDSDRVEEEMEDIINSKSNDQHITFARVSANNGVAEIQLDDWRALDKIEQLTRSYLQRSEVKSKLQEIANHLAKETLKRRNLQIGTKTDISDRAPSLPLPFLSCTFQNDVSPLPSPIAGFSSSNRAPQLFADLDTSPPQDRSPVSPITLHNTRNHDPDISPKEGFVETSPGLKKNVTASLTPPDPHRDGDDSRLMQRLPIRLGAEPAANISSGTAPAQSDADQHRRRRTALF